jgi:hypothetical protein
VLDVQVANATRANGPFGGFAAAIPGGERFVRVHVMNASNVIRKGIAPVVASRSLSEQPRGDVPSATARPFPTRCRLSTPTGPRLRGTTPTPPRPRASPPRRPSRHPVPEHQANRRPVEAERLT